MVHFSDPFGVLLVQHDSARTSKASLASFKRSELDPVPRPLRSICLHRVYRTVSPNYLHDWISRRASWTHELTNHYPRSHTPLKSKYVLPTPADLPRVYLAQNRCVSGCNGTISRPLELFHGGDRPKYLRQQREDTGRQASATWAWKVQSATKCYCQDSNAPGM